MWPFFRFLKTPYPTILVVVPLSFVFSIWFSTFFLAIPQEELSIWSSDSGLCPGVLTAQTHTVQSHVFNIKNYVEL